jgi:uncharacterized membrane protein YeaQ/YmgE (transglycosylase-associated protein family)
MLALLGWLAAGAAVGLLVRSLAPTRQHLGPTRAVALGAVGAGLGGLAASALLGPGESSGDRALTAGVVAAAGAVVVPWLYLAYGVRWGTRAPAW